MLSSARVTSPAGFRPRLAPAPQKSTSVIINVGRNYLGRTASCNLTYANKCYIPAEGAGGQQRWTEPTPKRECKGCVRYRGRPPWAAPLGKKGLDRTRLLVRTPSVQAEALSRTRRWFVRPGDGSSNLSLSERPRLRPGPSQSSTLGGERMTQIEQLRRAKPWPAWVPWLWLAGAVLLFLSTLLDVPAGPLATSAACCGVFTAYAHAASQRRTNKELLMEIDALRDQIRNTPSKDYSQQAGGANSGSAAASPE